VVRGLGRLVAVHEVLLSGAIDWAGTCVFADELAVMADDAVAQAIASRLVGPAGDWTTGQLRAALARAVLAVDPSAAERRKKAARSDSRVEVWTEASGNAALAGRELRPAHVIAIDRQLTGYAHWLKSCGVSGTIDQLRSLAYTTLLSGRELAAILDEPSCWPQNAGGPGNHGERSVCDGVADFVPAGKVRGDKLSGRGGFGRDGAESSPPSAERDDRPRDNRPAGGRAGDGGLYGAADSVPDGRGRDWPRLTGIIHLTMPLSAWLGDGDLGEVAGHGPIDGATGRELAAMLASDPGTRWCVSLTGATGLAVGHACAGRGRGPATGEPVVRWAAGLREKMQSLETGTCSHARQSSGYVPAAALRHLIEIRQRTCSAPGCRRAAWRCDLGHTQSFDQGGRTCECNLAPLCRRHHRAKQAPGWRLTQDQPGRMTWRLPSGREYQTTGPPYPG